MIYQNSITKKVIFTALVLMSFVLLAVPLSSVSAKAKGETQVTGVISENGNPIKNAKVTVTCNGTTKTDKTNKSGTYRVEYKEKKCAKGSTVTVSASTKDGKSGTSTGKADEVTTKLNVAVVNVSVPEIGTIASIAALIVAGGAIFYVRNRSLNRPIA
jgi:hypothetical protein